MRFLPIITNHAFVRFCERFEGIDTKDFRASLEQDFNVVLEWLTECFRRNLVPEGESGIKIKNKIHDRRIHSYLSKNVVDEVATKLRILEILADSPKYVRAVEVCGVLALRKITINSEVFDFEDGKILTMYRILDERKTSRKKMIKDKNKYCYEV